MVEIKMSTTEQNSQETTANNTNMSTNEADHVHLESVQRVAKLPVVEATINAATSLYEKAKESNTMINYALTTAESTVRTGVEAITPLAQPVANRLEGSIKKVDGMLCTGLDYVEHKVPCVKLPPGEMYTNTKNYISETVQPAVQSAKNIVEPAMQTAHTVLDPAMQTAHAVKDFGLQKVEEIVKGKRSDSTPVTESCGIASLKNVDLSIFGMSVDIQLHLSFQIISLKISRRAHSSIENEVQYFEHSSQIALQIKDDSEPQPHTCEKHSKNK